MSPLPLWERAARTELARFERVRGRGVTTPHPAAFASLGGHPLPQGERVSERQLPAAAIPLHSAATQAAGSPHVLLPDLCPRFCAARRRETPRRHTRLRQHRTRRRTIRRARAVRPHHRRAGGRAGRRARAGDGRPDLAARRLGGVRPVHDLCRCSACALCRPARAPPPAGGDDRLFRARDSVAAGLSRRHPFRPLDEGDAAGRRCALGHVAVVLPRSLRLVRRAGRAAADRRLDELAARAPARRPALRLRGPHRPMSSGVPRRCRSASSVITPISPSARPMRSAMSR